MFNRFRAELKASILERLSSRGSFVMSIVTNMLMLTLTFFFWNALTQNSSKIIPGSMTRNALLVYMVFSVILRSLIVTFSITWRVGNMITDGSIAGVLLKPTSFLEYWTFHQISRVIYTMVTLTIPLIILTVIFMPALYSSRLNILPFMLSSILGFYISLILNVLMGMTGFWLERADSIHQLNIVLYTLASGTLAPLALYPGFMKSIVNFLPYRAIIDTPLTILTNGDSSLIIIQLAWAVILSLVYKIVFRAGFKRLEVVGV